MTEILGLLGESQSVSVIAILRLADEASGVVIDSSELVVLIGDMFSVQCSAPGINISPDQSRVTF